MKSSQKLAVGVGIASGVLLTALLMSGSRGRKTRRYIASGVRNLRTASRAEGRKAAVADEPEVHYI